MDVSRLELASLKIGKAELAGDAPSLTSMLGATAPKGAGKALALTALTLLERFAELYVSLDAFIELFTPVADICNGVQADRLPTALRVRFIWLKYRLDRD